jgi:hypothetical protein
LSWNLVLKQEVVGEFAWDLGLGREIAELGGGLGIEEGLTSFLRVGGHRSLGRGGTAIHVHRIVAAKVDAWCII